jgi:hypothetical protein
MRLEAPAAGSRCPRNLNAEAATDICGYGYVSWSGHASAKVATVSAGGPWCISWRRDVSQCFGWH